MPSTTTSTPRERVYVAGERLIIDGRRATVVRGNEPDADWDLGVGTLITVKFGPYGRDHRTIDVTGLR